MKRLDGRNGRTRRWLACAMGAVLIGLLSAGAAVAADIEAVERRLGEGVVAGELSLSEAAHMIEALKDHARHQEREEHERALREHREREIDEREHPNAERDHQAVMRFERWIDEVGSRLHAAVEEGDLSEDDAWARWDHFKSKELSPKVKAAVEKGMLSGRAAREMWARMEAAEAEHREHGEHERQAREGREHAEREQPDWENVKHRIEAAVKRGDITREEANEKYAAIKREFAEQREQRERRERESKERDHREREQAQRYREAEKRVAQIKKELTEAVKSGKIGEEEAQERLDEARRKLRARLQEAAERKE